MLAEARVFGDRPSSAAGEVARATIAKPARFKLSISVWREKTPRASIKFTRKRADLLLKKPAQTPPSL